ncbi:hypothetical protein Cgig2_003109 [Carnegiea gigantea]|uniref:Uncharacterized protein n=1 Tax=Carnegiea gigantea TaxID=171969 RepID=A0A9Q1K1L7_9CARY|nr:hypothetical protein Cgig2_003109 [Carnegiea gigantea]
MSKLRVNSRTNKQIILTNEYENERISRKRENKLKLQSLGIKRMANSLTSLVDDTNAKRANEKQKSQSDNDVEYVPCCDDADEEFNPSGNELHEQEHDHASTQCGIRDTMEYQNLSSGNEVRGNEERRPINPGTVKKTRGIVYCKKLTTLPPGEKLTVEFDNDDISMGANGSSFSFILGNQVRNRTIIPVQVSGWDKMKPETLEHLWSCVQGVFSFDSPELRKKAILRHARALFRDSRHKLKCKYFDNPRKQKLIG